MTARSLAAILPADVVGFSKLIGEDEAGTLAALREIRKGIVNPVLAEHGGRIFKLMRAWISPNEGLIVSVAMAAKEEVCSTIGGNEHVRP
jgi:class 3 adenylate cyclase